jgi:hypothetical protein
MKKPNIGEHCKNQWLQTILLVGIEPEFLKIGPPILCAMPLLPTSAPPQPTPIESNAEKFCA